MHHSGHGACSVRKVKRGKEHIGEESKGKKREKGEDGLEIPIVSVDYMYMEIDYHLKHKGEEEYKGLVEGKTPVLVMHDSRSGAIFAHDVGSKGLVGDSVRCIMEDLADLGYMATAIGLKGDQEVSIRAVIDAVANNRPGASTTIEHSPVGESASNGAVENAIGRVQDQARTLRADLESKLGKEVKRDGNLFKWLMEWSASQITRYRITSTGLSAYGNIRGR